MQGFALSCFHPSVVILENLFNDTKYPVYMNEQGYGCWRQVSPNDIYVRRGFTGLPVSVACERS